MLGPLAVLLGGWLLLSGLGAVAWLTSPDAELTPALRIAAEVLVLAHGAPVEIAGQAVSIAPLGLTLLLLFLALPLASHAARQAAAHGAQADDTGELWVDGERLVAKVAGTFTLTYAAAVVILAAALGAGSWRAVVGGLVVGGVAGFWGAARGIGYAPRETWPAWLRSVPKAMGAATLTVLAGGAVVSALAVVDGWDRVTGIADALDGGTSGLILLIVLHLLYLPNVVLAGASWLLGAGLTLGDGSVVTMTITDVGLLPAIPVFGAVPPSGTAPSSYLWWLAVGVLAGAAAALVVGFARPRARFDETALVGGLSGVAAGVLIATFCSMAAGALGDDRLSHIGARMPELLVFAPTILGISGVAAGLALGLLRRRGRAEMVDQDTVDATPGEPTA
ncbi:cell division protein PerM [Tessaracoccus lubricantis]|uniref:cell division protein PerM n=1 Tax=Tessaracoccus lubricantis TaxID=545543 RepID=UPI0031EA3955